MKPVKILIISTLLLFVFSANAQQHSVTVLGGLNVSNMSVKYGSSNATIEDSYKMKLAFHAGVLFDYVLTKDRHKELSIEPGLIFDAKGYKQELSLSESQSQLDIQFENMLSAYYIDIPVYFKYAKKLRSRDKIYAGVGPYVGVGLFGKVETSYSGDAVGDESSESIKWGSDATEHDLKRLDYGVSAKVGYYSYGGLNISASYDLGLPNVAAAENPEFKHRVMRLSIGYSFRFDD